MRLSATTLVAVLALLSTPTTTALVTRDPDWYADRLADMDGDIPERWVGIAHARSNDRDGLSYLEATFCGGLPDACPPSSPHWRTYTLELVDGSGASVDRLQIQGYSDGVLTASAVAEHGRPASVRICVMGWDSHFRVQAIEVRTVVEYRVSESFGGWWCR